MRTVGISLVAGCIVGLLIASLMMNGRPSEAQEKRDRAECRLQLGADRLTYTPTNPDFQPGGTGKHANYWGERIVWDHPNLISLYPIYRACLEAKGYEP